MKDFIGKTVFIPGGSSGIGLSTAKLLAGEGGHVMIFARNKKRLDEAAEQIGKSRKNPSQRVDCLQLDVSDFKAVQKTMTRAVRDFGTPDILINCAGRAYPRNFEDISFSQFDETMRINMYGIWNTCSVLTPFMKERGGIIVNTSSMSGFIGVFGYTDYSASKFAIVGFSEALKSELKNSNISVQVLCPPDTDTPGFAVENTTKPDETKAISAAAKIMSPDDVARVLLKEIGGKTFMIIPNLDGKFTYIMKRLLPGVVDFVMDMDIKKVQKRRG
ncbi:MAG: short-chain dehydrogenase [Spirochaetae bacterium HGW-Spirochaetae-1]|jgi:short-subunit dehydrogenase|nr:MAG: short-chain dehydrogenase [Spirochaetae bacterium HGW-Spirochaetae-1]